MTDKTTVSDNDGKVSVKSVNLLYSMLQCRRPHNTDSERKFMAEFIDPLGVQYDTQGNAYKDIGVSPVVWSSHVDTVHDEQGKQLITVDKNYVATLHKQSKSNCLGADDTAGVWLMHELIKAKRPGLYIFHRGEERGCIGSRFIAKDTPELLKGRKCVIALDRRGFTSVITKQSGGRCCSDAFGNSLAAHMGGHYELDTGGTVTDSAQYTDLVGECTNLSVAYLSQHSKGESLDVPHLCWVRNRLLALDGEALDYKREPGDKFERHTTYSYTRHYGGSSPDNKSRYLDDDYIGEFYHGGYWDARQCKYIRCTLEEHKRQRAAYLARAANRDEAKKKAAEAAANDVREQATSVPQIKKHVQVDKKDVELDPKTLALVYMWPKTISKIFTDWGFDAAAVADLMAEYGGSDFKREMCDAIVKGENKEAIGVANKFVDKDNKKEATTTPTSLH